MSSAVGRQQKEMTGGFRGAPFQAPCQCAPCHVSVGYFSEIPRNQRCFPGIPGFPGDTRAQTISFSRRLRCRDSSDIPWGNTFFSRRRASRAGIRDARPGSTLEFSRNKWAWPQSPGPRFQGTGFMGSVRVTFARCSPTHPPHPSTPPVHSHTPPPPTHLILPTHNAGW